MNRSLDLGDAKKNNDNVFRSSMNSFFRTNSTAVSSAASFGAQIYDQQEPDDNGMSDLVSNTDKVFSGTPA